MSKNIEWKKSSIDYDKLNELTHSDLVRLQNGKNAIISGQLLKASINGGKTMGKIHYKNGTGIFSMDEKKKKQTVINGGKSAGKLAVERGTVVNAGKISAKSSKHPNNTLVKCEHCEFETTLPLYKRWHGNNCKRKPTI
jgi:hypothetical protein